MELNQDEIEIVSTLRLLGKEWSDHILMLLQVAMSFPKPPA